MPLTFHCFDFISITRIFIFWKFSHVFIAFIAIPPIYGGTVKTVRTFPTAWARTRLPGHGVAEQWVTHLSILSAISKNINPNISTGRVIAQSTRPAARNGRHIILPSIQLMGSLGIAGLLRRPGQFGVRFRTGTLRRNPRQVFGCKCSDGIPVLQG